MYLTDNTQKNIERCFLFNDDIFKNKNIGFITKIEISDSARNLAKGVSYFKIYATNSKGGYYTYDSSNDAIIVDTNSSKFLYNKYLFFIMLLLI